MRSVSSRAPSMRCVGASDEMIQLSTTEPMVEPMKPPMVAALTPRIAPPIAAANGGAGRAENEGGHGTSWSKGERKTEAEDGKGRPATGGRRSDPGHAVPARRSRHARHAMAVGSNCSAAGEVSPSSIR